MRCGTCACLRNPKRFVRSLGRMYYPQRLQYGLCSVVVYWFGHCRLKCPTPPQDPQRAVPALRPSDPAPSPPARPRNRLAVQTSDPGGAQRESARVVLTRHLSVTVAVGYPDVVVQLRPPAVGEHRHPYRGEAERPRSGTRHLLLSASSTGRIARSSVCR